MRVGIDVFALQLNRTRGRGIGNYTRGLVEGMGHASSDHEYTLVGFRYGQAPFPAFSALPEARRFCLWTPPLPLVYSWMLDPFRLPLAMLGLRVDLYHAIGLSIPYTLPFPIVVTVFDLIPLRFPEAYIGNPVWRLGYMNEIRLIRRAKQVIAISECTRQDIIRFLSVPPERITVTGCGVSRGFFRRCPPEHVEAVKRKHGLENPFVLYVGEFDPRKNFAGLVRIFARVREQVNSAVTLVAVGRLAPTYTQEIRGMIQKHGLEDSICLTGAVSNEDLHALFQASEVLAFPSLYEGFGLPCVEAMAAGTPVVAYAVSSLPEVVADAGILVPLNEEALFAEAIVSLLMDQTLRTQYIQKGMTHARQFTWENTARKTLEAYARAV